MKSRARCSTSTTYAGPESAWRCVPDALETTPAGRVESHGGDKPCAHAATQVLFSRRRLPPGRAQCDAHRPAELSGAEGCRLHVTTNSTPLTGLTLHLQRQFEHFHLTVTGFCISTKEASGKGPAVISRPGTCPSTADVPADHKGAGTFVTASFSR